MADIFLDNMYLALLIPLWLFLIIMIGRFFSVYVNKNIINILSLISYTFGSFLCIGALWKLPNDKILETSFPFLKINDFVINAGLHIDKLSLIFGLVLFLVAIFVQIFSISYMKDEKKTYRFYALINLFIFSMASLFFSPNLFQTYLFWELAGVSSYLLINFEYSKKEKSNASKKVFLINRIGDTALIGAIILCSYFIYAYAPNKALATLSFTDMNIISTLVYAYASSPVFEIICGLFIIGAVVKSAQFPFYNWLQNAMEAKLPVSALLHSSTLVASGVFITLRLLPFYSLESIILKIIAIIGIITSLLCSLSACAQVHIKKVLAYSTSAQFGLIFFAIGILNIKAGLILFIAHAFIKSMLFITIPNEDKSWNFVNFTLFLVGGLSLSGILLSGMVAKEFLALNLGTLGVTILAILSFLTAFYIIRIALISVDFTEIKKIKPSTLELIATIGLLLLNISFYFYLHKHITYKVSEPFWAGITAWICVYVLYIKKAFWKVPVLYPITFNGFYLDKLYNVFCENFYEKFTNLCNLIDKNIFANYTLPIKFVKKGVFISSFIENNIFNKFINNIKKYFRYFSLVYLKSQNGNIQKYNTNAFIIITIILTCLMLSYTAILIYIGG